MRIFAKRTIGMLLVALITLTSVAADVPQAAANRQAKDLSKAVVDSNLARTPDATKFGNWGYAKALYLLGQYLVYKRTHDPRYLECSARRARMARAGRVPQVVLPLSAPARSTAQWLHHPRAPRAGAAGLSSSSAT